MFRFHKIIIKLADNQSRHKIWDKFEFRPDQEIYVGVTCPWVPKKPIFILVCLVLIRSLWNLQINRQHNVLDSLERPDLTTSLKVVLEFWKTCPCHSLNQIFMKLTGMKYEMSLKLCHIAQEPIFDFLGMLGLRWAIVAHWVTCYNLFYLSYCILSIQGLHCLDLSVWTLRIITV